MTKRALLLLAPLLGSLGCGDPGDESTTNASGGASSGGMPTGGLGAETGGGEPDTTGGTGGDPGVGGGGVAGDLGGATTTGGVGTGAAPATGGLDTGGVVTTGGLGTGGETPTGGSGTGGVVTTGGVGAGGTTTGGVPPTGGVGAGGTTTGGSDTGGTATGGTGGGATGTGGDATGGESTGGGAGLPTADWPLINGVQWADTEGNPIQAHGGGVLKVGEDYYWFGENRNPDSTFFAVSVYRSRDLRQWELRNHALHMSSGPELNPANVERPKVVYNESTRRYVMWMHWENGEHYGEARAAVASSDTVDGDYTYHGSFRPYADSGVIDHGRPGYMSRDCTLFVDDDGTGYFLSATNENYDLNLYRLTDDYLDIDSLAATLFAGGHREAPALFKRNGVYFLLTSGATGWDPNQAQYATSRSLTSGWSSMTNVGDGNTFYSQSTYVLEVTGRGQTSYLYMGDRWAGAYGGPVNDSTYIWQPIAFPSDESMSMTWNNTLDIDTSQDAVSGSVERFAFINKNSGLALDVEGGSSANNADIIQAAPSDAESQRWSLNYNERGHFRLTNVMSGKVLDVPDESTEDGVELIQYDDLDGDNQAWRLIDLGNGEYRIRNQNSQKYAGVVAGSEAEGAAIEQRSETGGDEQIWIIEVATGG